MGKLNSEDKKASPPKTHAIRSRLKLEVGHKFTFAFSSG